MNRKTRDVKNISLVVLMLTLIVWAGCKKEERVCWDCYMYRVDGTDTLVAGHHEMCNMTAKEIQQYLDKHNIPNNKVWRGCTKR